MDHVGWDVIDAKRVAEGLPRAGAMGKHLFTPERKAQMALAGLTGQHVTDAIATQAADRWVRGGGDSEVFDMRQPEHVYLAGSIGLGEFDLKKIAYRRVTVG